MAHVLQGITAPQVERATMICNDLLDAGTSNPTKYACPAGTYTDRNDLTRKEDCETCPFRRACGDGTGGITTPSLPCAPGHYCPNGTEYPTQYPCPPGIQNHVPGHPALGTFTNLTNLASASECMRCYAGQYCTGGIKLA